MAQDKRLRRNKTKQVDLDKIDQKERNKRRDLERKQLRKNKRQPPTDE